MIDYKLLLKIPALATSGSGIPNYSKFLDNVFVAFCRIGRIMPTVSGNSHFEAPKPNKS